ncbi:SDR family NAD(P)-dependent oxidoreductase [Actinomyces bowdenii]|uniref:SDR family NAD(P)-dependent oxidoreductase n=1 Tax=Actinomyces bowdenii TaxID=131109 RepID=A0A853EHK2_9ACTO|nr:SDR family NAD(P)-dependent oxidoreductase [Actinomyces bowdenii]MBF0695877.1 SDR family NAD(P)-dependent oxidoreductase [Actinomyces bowdenii]NYS68050.1 SDR family NAD(P)-dependent oxidoreductase [Actinomyces bowdenii]
MLIGGFEERPETEHAFVELPRPDLTGNEPHLESCVRSWAEALRWAPSGQNLTNTVVVLDSGRMTAEESLLCATALVRALADLNSVAEARIVWACSGADWQVRCSATAAFGQVVSLEEAGLAWTSVGIDECDSTEVTRISLSEAWLNSPGSAEVRYVNGQRLVKVVERSSAPERSPEATLRTASTWLVSGGAGGLGRLVAKELAGRWAGRLVLLGRRPMDHGISDFCQELEDLGGQACYLSADLTDPTAVTAAVHEGVRRFGPLENVLHLAGISSGGLVRGINREELLAGWAAKVAGANCLDEATREQPLDRFVMFSSSSAYLGAPGQAAYAAASRGLCEFARLRNARVRAGHGSGRSQAIVWPVWEDGGMTLEDWGRAHLTTVTGLAPLPSRAGLDALELVLSSDCVDAFPVVGDLPRFRDFLRSHLCEDGIQPAPVSIAAAPLCEVNGHVAPSRAPVGAEHAVMWLTALVEQTARFPRGSVDPDIPFDVLGIDSLMVRRLGVAMEARLGPQPTSQFYEHRTIRELAGKLAADYPEAFGSAPAQPLSGTDVRPAQESHASVREDIAIIGMAGVFPGARDVDELWDKLFAGQDLVTPVPKERWDNERWYSKRPATPGRTNGKWGGFLEGVAEFDPLFFEISPREAELLDPQERLFLQTAWHAMEDAALSPRMLRNSAEIDGEHRVGVFVGVTSGQYQLLGMEQWAKGNMVSPTSSYWSVANRVSYFLDLNGPSMTIDSACSSSLVALHEACESIHRGESLVAITGAVNLSLHPAKYVALSQSRFLSSDGRCRAFGEGGDGYVPGEGAVAFVLKPISAARRDGDPVRAVIRSTAVNHGGRTNGYTVPGPLAQGAVVARALDAASVDPASISYVEAHGTGTALGDPIEIEGLERAFGTDMVPGGCAIGSVKSNIGHLEAAAGAAGVVKCVLQMQHHTLVPTLHCEPANRNIDWEHSRFRVQRAVEPWQPVNGGTLLATVSSFGAGGTNASLVLESFEDDDEVLSPMLRGSSVVLISARTSDDLRRYARRIREHLDRKTPAPRLVDIAWTLAAGREHLPTRVALRAATNGELRSRLVWLEENGVPDAAYQLDAFEADHRAKAVADWLDGGVVDLQVLFGERCGGRRIHLPGYPFQRDSYWVGEGVPLEEANEVSQTWGEGVPVVVHPDDPVVSQHVVNGRSVVPGVAHVLAMVGAKAIGGWSVEGVRLLRPLLVDRGQSTHAVVASEPGGRVRVLSHHGDSVTVHSTGKVVLAEGLNDIGLGGVESAGTRCTLRVDPASVYAEAASHGLALGPDYQRMTGLWVSPSGDEAVATVAVPADLERDASEGSSWRPAPALDSMLHPLLALAHAESVPRVPQSIERITLYRWPAREAFVHARLRSRRHPGRSALCDVTVHDEQGLCIMVRGLLAVPVPGTTSHDGGDREVVPQTPLGKSSGTIPCLAPVWVMPGEPSAASPILGGAFVLRSEEDFGLGDALLKVHHESAPGALLTVDPADLPDPEQLLQLLVVARPGDTVYLISGMSRRRYSADDPADAMLVQRHTVLLMTRLCQALTAMPDRARGVRVTIVTNDVQQLGEETAWNPFAGGLLGLTHVAAAELPGVFFTAVDVCAADLSGPEQVIAVATTVSQLCPDTSGQELALRTGVVVRKDHVGATLPMPLSARDVLGLGGKYLVIGGAGGLGMAVAQMLVTECSAHVHLVGRRSREELPAEVVSAIDSSPQLHYLQGDVTSESDMRRAALWAAGPDGQLDGVVHAAFVMGDRVLAGLDEERLFEVLAPKIAGSVSLCRALWDLEVNQLIFFSSAISFTGARGQGAYAAASSFMDAYGRYVASRWGRRVTILDWGFWEETGAVATDGYRARMAEQGVVGLSTEKGLGAFATVTGSRLVQVAPFQADSIQENLHLADRSDGFCVEGLREDIQRLQRDSAPLGDSEMLDEMEQVANHALVARTDLLGIPMGGEDPESIAQRLSVVSARRPLLDALLDMLLRRGFVESDGHGTLRPTARGQECRHAAESIPSMILSLRGRYPETQGFSELIDRSTSSIISVLGGAMRGNEVLFPRGSDHLVASVYQGSRRSDYFNSVVYEAVRSLVIRADRPLRIVEVGAGTGGTTDRLLAGLVEHAAKVERYDVTDISPTLVRSASVRYEGHAVSVRTGVLDIEKPPSEQGYDRGSYDVVVATNVFHATRDMVATLTHAADFLRPGGVLLVNEVTRARDFLTLVFGLAEGWWLAQDSHLRIPHSPLLSPGAWRLAATLAGFEHVEIVGAPGDESSNEQMVLLAERNSWTNADQSAELVGVSAPRVSDQGALPITPQGQVPANHDPSLASAPDQSAPGTVSDSLVDRLGTVYESVLGLRGEKIDPDQRLSAYGCDSVASLEVLDRLEQDMGAVPSELVLEATTLTELATKLSAVVTVADGNRFKGAADRVAAVPLKALPAACEVHEQHVGRDSDSPSRTYLQAGSRELNAQPPCSEVAIVGMSGRYPGAKGLDEWWDHLRAGRRSIGEVPPSRWDRAVLRDQISTRWGAFLDDVDHFDSLLFGISPREAVMMDPQARLFLQSVWELLDNAGYPRSRVNAVSHACRGVGVGTFVGSMYNPYELLAAEEWGRGHPVLASSGSWTIANRVSFAFGLDGPSIAVDSACSSSATAIHLACQSLRQGECGMAIVGGVNLILHPGHHLGLAQGGMLSAGGRPLPFSSAADGMVTAEGVGALLLRPLEDAIRDGDRILGCVLTSTSTSSGVRESFLSPHSSTVTEQLRATLRLAGLEPSDIDYVEAQAMGFPAGDAAEAEALRSVIGAAASTTCRVGTMKGLVGHLEAASGVAQVSKVLLQMRHSTIVSSVGASDPFGDDPDLGLRVITEEESWSGSAGHRRIALIDSFGAGGANTQIVIGEAPQRPLTPTTSAKVGNLPFLLSARRSIQLIEVARRLVAVVGGPRSVDLRPQDVAYTLMEGREPLSHRVAVVAADLEELATILRVWLEEPDREIPGLWSSAAPERSSAAGSPAERAAAVWVRGGTPRWASLEVERAQLTELSSYPFAPVRHWFSTTTARIPSPDIQNPTEENGLVSNKNAVPPIAPSGEEFEETGRRSTEVREALANVLQVEASEIEDGDPISDYGLDSVSVVALMDLLRSKHGAQVTASDFYEVRTVADLVRLVTRRAAEPEQALTERPLHPTVAEQNLRQLDAPADADAVAIIGMSARLPGAATADEYWRATLAGRVETRPFPEWRHGLSSKDDTTRIAHRGNFIDGIDEFDPGFFGISPREARLMDPQHRLFLQTAWHAVEDAGYDPGQLAASTTGIFVGVAGNEYGQILQSLGSENDGQLVTGNVHSVLANRVSFLLDLRGPSEPVDTACSSSLVAVHRAVRAIRSGECTMAIAGGVNVLLTDAGFDAFAASGMLSEDGRCRTFDSRADGYVRGEGVGAVLLKPLSAALADGDHIRAVIRGTAVGHGGRATSLSAPEPASQADVIVRAWQEAGGQEGPQYVEAHGTGTRLGDPVEVSGLAMAFEQLCDSGFHIRRCGLSTGKTGIGHLETAAGIAGLVRAVLALEHRIIPPLSGLHQPNELIDLTQTLFALVTSPQAWDVPTGPGGLAQPRRAGVSSFGFGGVNAHVALEEAPEAPAPSKGPMGPSDHVAVLSANDEFSLRHMTEALVEWMGPLGPGQDLTLRDVTFTLQDGRPERQHRLAAVAQDVPDLVRRLSGWLKGDAHEAVYHGIAEPRDRQQVSTKRDASELPTSQFLAERWVRGELIDWEAGRGAPGHRVRLPGYPFATHSYWLTPEEQSRQAPVPSGTTVDPVPCPDASPVTPSTTKAITVQPASGGIGKRTALVRSFRGIVAHHLETPSEVIDEYQDLRALGVDSIAGLRIMQAVQAKYGEGIPMLSIIEHPTIGQFVDKVLLPLDEDSATLRPDPQDDPIEYTRSHDQSPAPVFRLCAGSRPEAPPLFCLPGETGELSWALALIDEERDRMTNAGTVFGIESSSFRSGDGDSGRSLAERTSECVRAIKAEVGQEPIRLMAAGRGAVLGIEVARLLSDSDSLIQDLVLVEPLLELEPTGSPDSDWFEVARGLGRAWQVELTNSADGASAAQREAVVAVLARGRSGMDAETVELWLERSTAECRGLRSALTVWDRSPLVYAASKVSIWGNSDVCDRLIVPPPIEQAAPRTSLVHPAESTVSVVPINRQGGQDASFWCHSLLGDVSYALHLSRNLGVDHPLFGLEQFHLDGSAQTYSRVEQLAAAHIAAIREEDSSGPYILGGYSMGGIIAFETARQLIHAGSQISSLVLIDPIMPNTPAWQAIETQNIEGYDFELVALVLVANALGERWEVEQSISHEQLTGQDTRSRIDEVTRHLRQGSAKPRSAEEIRRLVEANHRVITRNNAALENYVPHALGIDVPTLFLRASKGQVGPDNPNQLPIVGRLHDDLSNGFAAYVGSVLSIKDVDADHFTICDQKHISKVASLIQDFWRS